MKFKFLIATALIVVCSSVFAQNAAATKFFDSTYSRLAHSMQKKDYPAAERLFRETSHPQFLYIGAKGEKQNGKQMMAMMKTQMDLMAKVKKTDIAITKSTFKGDTAVVRTVMTYAMTMNNPQTKKDSLWVGKSTSDDTWKKVGNGWKLYRVKAISEEATVDGKPFKM
jgi:hypothetical protein